ncbi:hypothetical protein QAD02_005642 [Eretmocerus hayati]|uniref:Uncharacterized protein n=1 Tax=Eretmocerus hayati TaxID=131215 RepID=A0ACC2NSW5_9HYME|nr:hypothetical protein QAD02_005642 [Eretmocerus hayati]
MGPNFLESAGTFISRPYESSSEFSKSYEHFVSDPSKFQILHSHILRELEYRVSNGDVDSLKHLEKILGFINTSKYTSKLTITDDDLIYLEKNNVIVLACKQEKLDILNYVLDRNNPILIYLNSFWGLMSSRDDNNKVYSSAWYHAIRSSNVKICNVLMNKWPQNQFTSDPEELDAIISANYEKLKLNNVYLSPEIETFVEDKLIDLRLSSGTFSRGPNRENFIDYIDERIQLLISCIVQLQLSEDVDEKFLFIAKSIAQNIHSLKRKLKSSYELLPWEEVEFCVVSFVSSHSKKQEMNLFYRSTLNRNKLCKHLQSFAEKLINEKEKILKTDPAFLCTLPKVNRTDNIKQIVKSHPEFEDLYIDYQEIRDMHSLDKISRYAKIASAVDVNQKEGQIILVRSLQVLGEHLKNTLESPKLSDFTSELILLTLPANTRKVVINLRNCLSHVSSLAERIEIEENSGVDFFANMQDDIKKIGSTIDYILYSNKTKTIKSLMKKVVDCQNLDELKAIADIFNNFDKTDGHFENEMDLTFDRKKIENLVNELKSYVSKPSDYEDFFKKMEDIIKKEKGKMSDMRVNYAVSTGGLENLLKQFKEADNANEHDLRDTKYLVEKHLSAMEPEFETHHLKEIGNLSASFLDEVQLRGESQNFEKLNRIVRDIFQIVEFEIDDTKSVNEFRERLNKKFNFGFNKYNRNHAFSDKTLDNKLSAKLSDLKSILKGNLPLETSQFLSIKSNDGLVAALEMLILDILSILGGYKNRLQDNLYFLDKNTPLLIGKCLRNHLAHDNNLKDVLLSDPSIALILNAQKLASESESLVGKPPIKQAKRSKTSPSNFKSKFERGLETIVMKNKMLTAVKDGNLKDLNESIKGGCDMNARDINGRTALHYACEGGNLEIVKFIVDTDVDINLKDNMGRNALHTAAAHGKNDVVEFLIKEKFMNPNEFDEENNTPLHLAARYGHLKTVEILIKHGSMMNIRNKSMYIPLHFAVENGHRDIVELFLKKKVDIQSALAGGLTPLHLAAERGLLDLVILLVQYKANIHAIHDRGVIPLHMAVMNGYLEIARFLIEKGSDINAQMTNGLTALHYAVECGYENLVDLLLSHGAVIDSGGSVHKNPLLHSAAYFNHLGIVKKLLEHGADAHASAHDGAIPIYWATQNGHLEIIKELLKYPVNLDHNKRCAVLSVAVSNGSLDILKILLDHDSIGGEDIEPPILSLAARMGKVDIVKYMLDKGVFAYADVDDDGIVPIHGAAQEGHLEIVEILLANGSKIDVATPKGKTALYLAAQNGHTEIVDFLLKKGAVVDGPLVSVGLTPLMIAASKGHGDCVDLLVKGKAKVNVSAAGITPLHAAARCDNVKSVRVLLDHGAKVHCKDDWGYTPLSTAIVCKQKEIVDLLMLEGAAEDADFGKLIDFAVKTSNKDIVDILLRDRKFVKDPSVCPLTTAIRHADEEILKILIQKGADINSEETDLKMTPLYAAATYGQERIAKFLIENGANLDARVGDGATALHVSGTINDTSVLSLLLNSGANPCLKDDHDRLPLHVAIMYGRLASVQILMPYYKHDINACLFENGSLLHLASEVGFLEIVKYLVSLGADINVEDSLDLKPIHHAAQKAHKDVVEYFVNQGMGINVCNSMNQTLLFYAKDKNHQELVEYLLANGIDIHSTDSMGVTALHMAVSQGNEELIKLLLEKGACFDALDFHQKKPIKYSNDKKVVQRLALTEELFEIVKKNNVNAAKKLIESGAVVNAKNAELVTALHLASQKGNEEMVKLLLMNGADINAPDTQSKTPLHYATKNSHLETIKFLLTAGAIYNAATVSGQTPSGLAKNSDILKIFKLINETFQKVKDGDPKIVKDLMKIRDRSIVKAVMGATNKEGETLIAFAEKNNFPKINQLKNVIADEETLLMTLGQLLNQTENYDGAIESFTEVVETRKSELGPNNPSTFEAEMQLAVAMYKKEKYPEAWKMFSSLYKKQKTKLGENHKSTLKTRSYMALVLYRQQNFDESLKIFEDVYPKQKSILQPDDADLLETETHMANTLTSLVARLMAKQGKRIGAAQLFNECLGPDKAKLGASHPHVKTAEAFFESFKLALRMSGEIGMLEEVNNFGETLKTAVLMNDAGTVGIFIENGGDLNSRYEDGTTILHWAVQKGNIVIVNMILDAGANITLASNKGNTPLHTAVAGNLKEIVEILLKHAASHQFNDFPNIKTTNSGSTALHVACKKGNFDIVQLLLQYGAVYNIKNNKKEKPVDLCDNTSMIKFFNLIDEAFSKVCDGKVDVIDSLRSLKPGFLKAITNARNTDQKTLMQVAISNKQREIAARLLGLLRKSD